MIRFLRPFAAWCVPSAALPFLALAGLAGAAADARAGAYVADPETTRLIQELGSSDTPPQPPFPESPAEVEDHADLLAERSRAGLARELSKFRAEKNFRVYLRVVPAGTLPAFAQTAMRLVNQGSEPAMAAVFTQDAGIYLHAFNEVAVRQIGADRLATLVSAMLNENQGQTDPEKRIIGSLVSLVRGVVRLTSAPPPAPEAAPAAGSAGSSEGQPRPGPSPGGGAPLGGLPPPAADPSLSPAPAKPEASPAAPVSASGDEPPLPDGVPAGAASPAPAAGLADFTTPPVALLAAGGGALLLLVIGFALVRAGAKRRQPTPLKMRQGPGLDPAMPVYNRAPRAFGGAGLPPDFPEAPRVASPAAEEPGAAGAPRAARKAFPSGRPGVAPAGGPGVSGGTRAARPAFSAEPGAALPSAPPKPLETPAWADETGAIEESGARQETGPSPQLVRSLVLLETYAAELRRAPAERRANILRAMEILLIAVKNELARGARAGG